MKEQQHIFTNKMLRSLLVPVIFEQVLNSLMGTVDTMMVSNVGSAAISAVSLVDSINVLVIQAFSALAAGGAIICSQYIGQKNHEMANKSARQVLFIITAISAAVTALCLAFRMPLLQLIFGKVEADVMTASRTYFFYTALSFPFIALYDAGASIFRSQGNTRGPMVVSVISNVINIGGNAVLIWVFHMGVAGAAIATLASRVFCAVVVLWQLRLDRQPIVVKDYIQIRPDGKMISRILALGIPSGVENSMFQLGKLAIQSSVSTLGTVAIAAQAMTNILENLNGIAAIGVGIGLMTVVGQCLGAGRKDEAVYYIKKLCVLAEIIIIASCLLVFALTIPITKLGGMEPESSRNVLPHGILDHNCQTTCMGYGLHPCIRFKSSRRRKILNGYILHYHVGIQILSLCISHPLPGLRSNGRMDRNVYRLDHKRNHLRNPFPQPQVAES